MITELIQVIISEDPDVLTGFEIDNRSWGYVAKRFNFLNQNSNKKFESEISRIKNKKGYCPPQLKNKNTGWMLLIDIQNKLIGFIVLDFMINII